MCCHAKICQLTQNKQHSATEADGNMIRFAVDKNIGQTDIDIYVHIHAEGEFHGSPFNSWQNVLLRAGNFSDMVVLERTSEDHPSQ